MGDYVHVYKNEQGGFCPGDIVRIPIRQLLVRVRRLGHGCFVNGHDHQVISIGDLDLFVNMPMEL